MIDAKTDLTGMKIGRWTVLSRAENNPNYGKMWNCQCECGTQKVVAGKYLRNGQSKSCGCFQKELVGENSKHKVKDITNQKFGKLTVISRAGSDKNGKALWNCICDCGNHYIALGADLRNGHTNSYGCLKNSLGEFKIKEILDNNKISYETEKTFNSCKGKRKLRFDFYVNNQYLIEFDGRQHEHACGGWSTEDAYENLKERDGIKNQWCKEHHIPLIRIPYSKLKTLSLQDLLLDTSSFIIEGGV